MVKMFSHQWPSILIKMYIGNSYSCVFLFFNNGNIYALSYSFFYDIFSYQHNIPYCMGKTVPISSLSWCSFGIKMMHCYFSKAFQHFSIIEEIVFYKVVTNNSFFFFLINICIYKLLTQWLDFSKFLSTFSEIDDS